METATQVLVIIVSATLTIFLFLAIVVVILAIKVLRSFKRVAEKAELIAQKAESLSSFFEQASGKLFIGKLLTNFAKNFRGDSKSKNKED